MLAIPGIFWRVETANRSEMGDIEAARTN